MIRMKCDEFTLDDGTVVNIGKQHEDFAAIRDALCLEVYKAKLKEEKNDARARMSSCLLLGFNDPSSLKRYLPRTA